MVKVPVMTSPSQSHSAMGGAAPKDAVMVLFCFLSLTLCQKGAWGPPCTLIQRVWEDPGRLDILQVPQEILIRTPVLESPCTKYCGLKTGLLMSPMVGFIVTNQCTFHSPVGFPQIAVAVLVMEKVGHSSVHYRLALFPPTPTKEPPSVDLRHLSDGFFFGHPKLAQFAALACTTGSSVHVFVNPAISKPVGLPEDFRQGFLWLMSPAPV
ncbi:uncharacterized protein LOC112404561 [Neophocaena asiaeorientalis asiaeorientalis]|uniref:Uncharacterized protein LOC112404561 n=1 Tax=Neophocaena asiaeorientalis asiaeorientalis TaxID=1706337 RepID=A0A341C1Z6_NEOAA|nr:uncharacterized protein LOC112404561 [Neophocaena asiaeorientalis asiaeorientalis]